MMLKVQKLKNMTADQLYKTLHKEIQEIYEEHQFMGISKEYYDTLIRSFLDKCLNNFSGQTAIKELDSSYFITYIRKNMICYMKGLAKEKHTAIQMISNYISMNLKEQSEGEAAILELERLSVFLHRISFDVIPDILFELIIRNTNLNNLISVFVLENKELIQENMESVLNFHDITNSFIETYCMMFGITNDNTRNNMDFYEVRPLVLKAQAGDISARDEIVYKNLGLVRSIASKYQYSGFPFEDVVQVGTIGLLEAIDKFKPEFGCPFATYAIQWIRCEIVRNIANCARNIRIPVGTGEQVNKLYKIQRELTVSLGRDPEIEEISEASGFSEKKIVKLQKLFADTESIEELETSNPFEMAHCSFAKDFRAEENIADSDILQKFHHLLYKECNLQPLELEILLRLYGFYGSTKTQVEVAKELGITSEAVRQREAKAIRELRRHSSIKEYAILMDNPTKAMKRIDLHREQYKKYGSRATYTLKLLDEEQMKEKSAKKKVKSK